MGEFLTGGPPDPRSVAGAESRRNLAMPLSRVCEPNSRPRLRGYRFRLLLIFRPTFSCQVRFRSNGPVLMASL